MEWTLDSFPLLLESVFLRHEDELLRGGLWRPLDHLRRCGEAEASGAAPADPEEALLAEVLSALAAGRAEALDRYLDSLAEEPPESWHWLAHELDRWRRRATLPRRKALEEGLAELADGRETDWVAALRAALREDVGRRPRQSREACLDAARLAGRRGALRLEAWLLREAETWAPAARPDLEGQSAARRERRREACRLACHRYGRMIGRSLAFRELVARLHHAAGDALPVLLVGATGTGKELAVEYLHGLVWPKGAPLVAVNCAGLGENLAEAELFGSAKGAFTGAVEREGLVSQADGGLLFLDEFGALPAPVQAKLLRFLESGVFRPVGDPRERRVQVRVAAATCEDQRLAGEFRQDLLHRVAGHLIRLPDLSSRLEDLPLLVRAFLLEAGVDMPERHVLCSAPGMARLRRMAWPGNVRQLRHLVLRLARRPPQDVLREIAETGTGAGQPQRKIKMDNHFDALQTATTLREEVSRFEWTRIQQELARCAQDKRLAARRLGLSLPTLYARLKRGPAPPPSGGELPELVRETEQNL